MKKIYSIVLFFVLILNSNIEAFSSINSDTIKLKTMQNDTVKCNLLNQVAEEFRDFNTEMGLVYANTSLELSTNLNFKSGIAGANKAIGLNFWRMGVYDAALEHFLQAISIFEALKDDFNVAKCNNNIGLIFFAREQYDKALSYLNKSLATKISSKNPKEISRVMHNMALIYYEQGEINKSLDYHIKSLNFAEKAKDSVLMAYNYCFIGRNYSHFKKFKEAKYYLDKSFEFFTILNTPNNVAMVYNQTADYFYEKTQYDSTIYYAQKGYALGDKIGNKYMKMESSKFIYKSYQMKNDFKNAFKYSLIHFRLADTMQNESNVKEIAYKEARYDFLKKLKIAETEKTEAIYKNQFIARTAIIIAILLFVIALIVYAFYRLRTKTNNVLLEKNLKISELNEKLEITNSTKDKFFSILAHDLKNPLGNFQVLSNLLYDEYETFSSEERREYLKIIKDSSKQLYVLLENLLQWSRSQRGLIAFEPESNNLSLIVKNSIDLLRLSAERKKIELINLVPDDIIVFVDNNLITTVIRNLISNSVKFTPEGGKVEIGINPSDSETSISVFVKDNGIGMNSETMDMLFKIDSNIRGLGTEGEEGTGLGLILCKEFIDKHNGKIDVKSRIGEGSTFYFTLPIISKS